MVKTRRADAAKTFYSEQLGIRLALEQDVPEWGGTQLFFRASSMSIEVIASDQAPEQDELWGLALKTQDMRYPRAADDVRHRSLGDSRRPQTRHASLYREISYTGVPTLLIQHP